jgi:hypothetical protein
MRPDGLHSFGDWLRLLPEELFVIDALALYLQRDRAGRLAALLPFDGATGYVAMRRLRLTPM